MQFYRTNTLIRSFKKLHFAIFVTSLVFAFLIFNYSQAYLAEIESKKLEQIEYNKKVKVAKSILSEKLQWSKREIDLLKSNELLRGYKFDLKKTNSVSLTKKFFTSNPELELRDFGSEMFRYVNPDGSLIPVDKKLPIPVISISQINTPYPKISAPKAFNKDGNQLLTFFEFDITPEFNSPNFWRYPVLLPNKYDKDRTTRFGMQFGFRTVHEASGLDSAIEFPFRTSAMRLPLLESELTPDELRKQAAALGWGLNKSELIKEIFNYVRHSYSWGDDDLRHTPYDTFISGVGECGYLNDLAGLFFEMNGTRYRGVSGFNPIARTVFPGGGHSAIEIWNEDTRKWNYFDTYLNILMDLPISEVKNSKYRDKAIYATKPSIKELGDYLSLEQLFRYVSYYDKAGRLPIMSRHNILNKSDGYGKYWDTVSNKKYNTDELFRPEFKIFVRARYVDTNGVSLSKEKTQVESFSNFSTTSFSVNLSPFLN